MKVLLLGGDGFIGSVLAPYLEEKGDVVTIYDNFLYRESHRKADMRDINKLYPFIDKTDAVVNLAGLSNDPLADLKPSLTWEINYKANEVIAKLLQSSGKRVVFASSCSVYGFGENEFSETSKLNPVTLYARTKMLSEELYLHKDIDSIILRLATVYGYSPNPRFDLVVNTMIATSYFKKKIVINGGAQWRPVVHVKDVARAIYHFLHGKNRYKIYNIGSNKQNYKVMEIGHIIHAYLMGKPKLLYNDNGIDKRSYRVNFNRLKNAGFKCQHDIEDAIDELYDVFEGGTIKNMNEDVYFRVKYLKKLWRLM